MTEDEARSSTLRAEPERATAIVRLALSKLSNKKLWHASRFGSVSASEGDYALVRVIGVRLEDESGAAVASLGALADPPDGGEPSDDPESAGGSSK